MKFEIIDEIQEIEIIAIGSSICDLAYLQKYMVTDVGENKKLTMTNKNHFVICIDNTDYEASLIVRKMYEVIPDPQAEKDDMLRVIDESGEDYLFHISHFISIDLPAEVERALVAA